MSAPAKLQILKLYKDLLRYGQQLHLTDKQYYINRIQKEFAKNRELIDVADINYNFKVCNNMYTFLLNLNLFICRKEQHF